MAESESPPLHNMNYKAKKRRRKSDKEKMDNWGHRKPVLIDRVLKREFNEERALQDEG